MKADRVITFPANAAHRLADRLQDENWQMDGAEAAEIARDIVIDVTEAVDELRASEAPGAMLIAAERRRQVEAEGWTPDHDDTHDDGALARAAATYALYARRRLPAVRDIDERTGAGIGEYEQVAPPFWPRGWEYKPTSELRDLIRAGALIAAEIDRLERAKVSADA